MRLFTRAAMALTVSASTLVAVGGCTQPTPPFVKCDENCPPIVATAAWSVGLDGPGEIVGLDETQVYVAVDREVGSELLVMDARTGAYRWNFRTPAFGFEISVRPKAVIIVDNVESGRELTALNPVGGDVLWQRSLGGPAMAIAADGHLLTTRDRTLQLSDLLGVREEWTSEDGCSPTAAEFDEQGRIIAALECGGVVKIAFFDDSLKLIESTEVEHTETPYDFASAVGDFTLLGAGEFGDLTVVWDRKIVRNYVALAASRVFSVRDGLYFGIYDTSPFRLSPDGSPATDADPASVMVEVARGDEFPLSTYRLFDGSSTAPVRITLLGYAVEDWAISRDGQTTFEVIGPTESVVRAVRYGEASDARPDEPITIDATVAAKFHLDTDPGGEPGTVRMSYSIDEPDPSSGRLTIFRVSGVDDLDKGIRELHDQVPENSMIVDEDSWFADSGYLSGKANEAWTASGRCLIWIYQDDGEAVPSEALISTISRDGSIGGCT